MKTILSLATVLIITGGLMGCNTIANNANLRNANSNTGYLVNNSNMASPIPAATVTPSSSNIGSNMGRIPNTNSNHNSNTNTQTNTNVNKAK